MSGTATPRDGERRSHPLPSPYEPLAPSAAELAKARWIHGESGPAGALGLRIDLPASLGRRLETLAPADNGLRRFLDELGRAVREDNRGQSDIEAFAAGMPLEPATARRISEPHVQSLLADFHHRQRRANLLVMASVGACLILTLVGVVTIVSLAVRDPQAGSSVPPRSTSIAWQDPQSDAGLAAPGLVFAAPDRTSKSEPLLIRAAVAQGETEPSPASAQPEPILMQEGHALSLAPLLSQRQAPYLLLRGLPEQARLSAGQRNPSGAWLVKNEDLGQLTLTIAGASSGDYPLEIYALGDGALAQGRQRLVIRVEPEVAQAPVAPVGDMNWATVLSTMTVPGATTAAVSVDPSPSMAKAMRLLEDGDIAGARTMFQRVSEARNAKPAPAAHPRTLASLSD